MNDFLLDVKNLKFYYQVKVRNDLGFYTKKDVRAVDSVSFSISRGETLGIVGESGCGKTTIGKIIVKLLKPLSGSVLFEGKDIFQNNKYDDRQYKKNVQIVFQDPYSSLDPRFTVGKILAEPFTNSSEWDEKSKQDRILGIMDEVGLKKEYYTRFPHEFSGGQRQRIGVARALALNPSMIVCDEPVSALDVSIQAQILNLMASLREKHNLTYIFISHNLSVIKHISDKIMVMYLGKVMEISSKSDLFSNHKHPYTDALINAIPVPDPRCSSLNTTLEGEIPNALEEISGCVFKSRCKYAKDVCDKVTPDLLDLGDCHYVACHLYR